MSLRGAVLGLGQIGRHHARLLQDSERATLATAVDAAGDPYRAVRDPSLLRGSLEELLAAGDLPDFAIVALPTAEHRATALALAEAGVHVLVEKPLAGSVEDAQAIIDGCERAGVHAAVGHVERYNPALIEMRRRMGDLGRPFLVATERNGPFPDRVRDVGVVMDLATHDLDIVSWLAGAPIASVSARSSKLVQHVHEDLVSITGLAGEIVFNSVVDRVTPTKVRRTRVLGERGMLLADTLTADLTFYENAHVASEWERVRALRGVAEGNATRYAIPKREPLSSELDAFLDLVERGDGAGVVTLREGLEAVRSAEAVLRSAETGETVHVGA